MNKILNFIKNLFILKPKFNIGNKLIYHTDYRDHDIWEKFDIYEVINIGDYSYNTKKNNRYKI